MRSRNSLVSIPLSILLACAATAASADDQGANPHVYGKTIGDWGHAWWQWALGFSAADNPILLDGAVDCSAGQSGHVWFLAGTFGGEANRSCSVPRGKALFFGIINGIFWAPEDAPDEAGLRAGVAGGPDDVIAMECHVDGTPCAYFAPITRQQSRALPLNIEDGTIAVDFGYAPGVRPISVADGYWVMLAPLPPGTHEVHFAVTTGSGFALDVTHAIDVE